MPPFGAAFVYGTARDGITGRGRVAALAGFLLPGKRQDIWYPLYAARCAGEPTPHVKTVGGRDPEVG
ncbi:MAG: hypothetical protein NVSMB22_19520 [Chloroflexota bacterium]